MLQCFDQQIGRVHSDKRPASSAYISLLIWQLRSVRFLFYIC